MLHITTGANGAGKTLNTLKWVRERQVKEDRPVCYNGRFDIVEDGELKNWKKVDIKNWQDEPDGTIFFVDEAHNDFPNRPSGAVVPDYVKMLAEHRKRGFDFYLISQHPGNIDAFVRRLVGAPGWHRHLKRVAGGSSLVSCIQWDAVNPNCERNGSGATGEVTMIPFPKQVYGWYKSATLHTAKLKIPKAAFVLVFAALGAAYLGWSGFRSVAGPAKDQPQASAAASASGDVAAVLQGGSRAQPMSTADYLNHRRPRISDLPHTAPAYDQVTTPSVAPYPAACVRMGDKCRCYTQQATIMRVSFEVCQQVVTHGFFVDWQQAQQQVSPPSPVPPPERAQPAPAQPQVVVMQAPPAAPPAPPTWAESLALRNAQVRSDLVGGR